MNLTGIALAQIDITPGRPDLNFEKILAKIAEAKALGQDVIVFPEMAVPGYLLGDRFESDAFIRDLQIYNERIREASVGITVIWGSVLADFKKIGEDGRTRKYNAAFIASQGKWVDNTVFKGHTIKTLLPKYREFDDERHFYSLIKLMHENSECYLRHYLQPFPVLIAGQICRVGLILCEDMWCMDYADNPTEILIQNGAEIIINISASPWTWRKNDKRHRVVKNLLKGKDVPFLYCNNVGAQNNGKDVFLFDGNSTVYGQNGDIMQCAEDHKEEFLLVNLSETAVSCSIPPLSEERDIEELHKALLSGLKYFFSNRPDSKVVIGVSGGIDSALVTTLLVQALGPDCVYAVNMPSVYNSHLTKDAALELVKNLKIHYAVIPVQEHFELTTKALQQAVFIKQDKSQKQTKLNVSGFVQENIQARHRGSTILAGVAAALGAVFTNNGNKTETAIGYATLYGDVNGAIAPLADLYKHQVYALSRHINTKAGLALIPESILNMLPSAELSPDQNIEEGKGDPILYDYHDHLLKAWIEFRFEPEDILRWYDEGKLEEKLKIKIGLIKKYFATAQAFIQDLEEKWTLFNRSIFKRIQTPPIIAVSKRAFGFDLRESQNGVYFTQAYLELKKKILGS